MGNCVSSQIAGSSAGVGAAAVRGVAGWGPTAKVVHMGDGRAREYKVGVATVGHVEADSPGYYLCSSEALHVGQRPYRSAESEELQPGQLYFLLPVASLGKSLTLQDLCEHAVRANAALRRLPPSAKLAATGRRRVKNPPTKP